MSNNIESIQKDLYEAADHLHSNSSLNSSEYGSPVLGLIFLRHTTTRFKQVNAEITSDLLMRGGKRRDITAKDFTSRNTMYLPEEARYDYLVYEKSFVDHKGCNLSLGGAINRAMRLIEKETPMLEGALPIVYDKLGDDVLRRLLRIFNRESLKNATGDVFGRVYEYFLTRFAMTGESAQDNGQFFTPPSLVRLIVNIIEPERGIVFDPACGSGGDGCANRSFFAGKSIKPI